LLQKIFKLQASTYFAFLKIIKLTAQELLTATELLSSSTDTAQNQNFKRLPTSHLSTSRNLVVFLKNKRTNSIGQYVYQETKV